MIGKIWKNIENTAINNPNRALDKAYWFGCSMAALGAELGIYLNDLIERGERGFYLRKELKKVSLNFMT